MSRSRRAARGAVTHGAGIDRGDYGSIERGERNVSLDNICLIAAGLEVPPAELLQFDALPAPEPPPAEEVDGEPPFQKGPV